MCFVILEWKYSRDFGIFIFRKGRKFVFGFGNYIFGVENVKGNGWCLRIEFKWGD